MIDVGKSFLPAATEWFPKYGLRRIDAVLITHAHADGMFYALLVRISPAYPPRNVCLLAMNGLDDLRGEPAR